MIDPKAMPPNIAAAHGREPWLKHHPDCPCPTCLRQKAGQPARTEPASVPIVAKPHETNPGRPLPNPEPQRHETPALGEAAQGEAPMLGRVLVRIVGYRVRPLDPDNFAGSCKDCIDFLRHARLIDGDEPWRIRLETEQVKVGTFKEEKTVIELTHPDGPATTAPVSQRIDL